MMKSFGKNIQENNFQAKWKGLEETKSKMQKHVLRIANKSGDKILSLYNQMKMNEENIFFEEDSFKQMQNQQFSVFDVDDEKYVDQFIQIQNQAQNLEKNKNKVLPQDQQNIGSTNKGFGNIQGPTLQGKKKPNSSCHNFQKHLVLTLRNLVKLTSFHESPQSFQVQRKLWRAFMRGKKMNKTLIGLTLISMDFFGKSHKQNRKIIKKYGFEKISKDYNYFQIKQAQKNLRKAVLQDLLKEQLSQKFQKRKIKKKEEFQTYFQSFVFELKSGHLQKRMALKKASSNSQQSDMSEEQPQERQFLAF